MRRLIALCNVNASGILELPLKCGQIGIAAMAYISAPPTLNLQSPRKTAEEVLRALITSTKTTADAIGLETRELPALQKQFVQRLSALIQWAQTGDDESLETIADALRPMAPDSEDLTFQAGAWLARVMMWRQWDVEDQRVLDTINDSILARHLLRQGSAVPAHALAALASVTTSNVRMAIQKGVMQREKSKRKERSPLMERLGLRRIDAPIVHRDAINWLSQRGVPGFAREAAK